MCRQVLESRRGWGAFCSQPLEERHHSMRIYSRRDKERERFAIGFFFGGSAIGEPPQNARGLNPQRHRAVEITGHRTKHDAQRCLLKKLPSDVTMHHMLDLMREYTSKFFWRLREIQEALIDHNISTGSGECIHHGTVDHTHSKDIRCRRQRTCKLRY